VDDVLNLPFVFYYLPPMQAYIAISYKKRKQLQPELDAIKEVLKQYSIIPFVFVDNYNFKTEQEKPALSADREMMQAAFAEIDKCDLLIAEVSDKAIGIGIEVGYAKAKNKPVIYLRHVYAEHSTTVSGSSDYTVIYADTSKLQKQLNEILKLFTSLLT
jgi:nucleoside 2-deoxyribosyltransferase